MVLLAVHSPPNLPQALSPGRRRSPAALAGWDAVALLWHEGSNKTQDYAVLTMPLSSQTLCNPSNNREVRFQGGPDPSYCEGVRREGRRLP